MLYYVSSSIQVRSSRVTGQLVQCLKQLTSNPDYNGVAGYKQEFIVLKLKHSNEAEAKLLHHMTPYLLNVLDYGTKCMGTNLQVNTNFGNY